MILLDTNVLSELMRREPSPAVVLWLDSQPPESVWTTSVTTLEVSLGLRLLKPGRRRTALTRAFDEVVRHLLEGRIAPFDYPAAQRTADLAADRQRQGRPIELRDAMIAGIAAERRAPLATRNVRHFRDLPIEVIDPWESSAEGPSES